MSRALESIHSRAEGKASGLASYPKSHMCRSKQCPKGENTKVLGSCEYKADVDGCWRTILQNGGICERTRMRLKGQEALVLHIFLVFTRKMCNKGLSLGLS